MSFYTEKQIEQWLESETRHLPMPDGSQRPHTTFKLAWSKVDSMILVSGYGLGELVGFALDEVRLQGVSFDEAFTGVVSWLDEQRRDRWGISRLTADVDSVAIRINKNSPAARNRRPTSYRGPFECRRA